MFRNSSEPILGRIFTVTALVLLMAANAWPGSYQVVYNFRGARPPSSGLITDAAGNAYGTTLGGGINNAGTVYELSPTKGALLVYAFHGRDGMLPQGNLVFDSAGNLYGTTVVGGSGKGCGTAGCGVVFKLSPPANGGTWTETVLYNFCSQPNCADGANPQAGVILDSAGNVYGTTAYGGSSMNCASGCGTVFELQPSQSDWMESVLYTFMGLNDGSNPLGALVFDKNGNPYGTASNAGGGGGGTVFELSPSGGGWNYSAIYTFAEGNPHDGGLPEAGLIFDAAGNLFGTTAAGGMSNLGTVFELSPNAGTWTETILYNFAGGNNDGAKPESPLVFDSSGNLYGTTFAGGSTSECNGHGCGTVFRLTQQGGQWSESLYRFNSNLGILGRQPTASVLLDAVGNVYGTTTAGGSANGGVMFKIIQ